jgi:hypothetical protein
MVDGLRLADTWQQDPTHPVYTHFSPTGATRIDRIYITPYIQHKKIRSVIYATAFTDHEAIVLSINLPRHDTGRRRHRWTLDPAILRIEENIHAIRDKWSTWRNSQRHYPTPTMWWERVIKPRTRRLLQNMERNRYADHRLMGEHLYTCLYEVMRSTMPPEKKRAKLQRYKARLIQHNATKPSRAFLQMAQKDLLEGETPSLYHIIRNNRRRSTKRILQIVDETGQVHTTPNGIAQAFL